MGKIKDLIYDTSDVIVAFFIVVIAGIIIAISIGNILDYPSFIAEQQQQEIPNFGLAVPMGDESTETDEPEAPVATPEAVTPEPDEVTPPVEQAPVVTTPQNYTVVINSGESMNSIAQKLVNLGLFTSSQHFTTTVVNLKADNAIKAGTFTIPSNSTPEQVIQILSK